VRPVIVSGVIMMNKLRVPSAHGTGPSFHNEVNMYSRVTRSADPRTKTLQPDSRSSSMWSICLWNKLSGSMTTKPWSWAALCT
jgi:hypothetical protein